MSETEAVQAWKQSAQENLDFSIELIQPRKYHHSLFFLHLAIEKIIKAYHQFNRHEPAPFVHNLTKLAEASGISLSEIDQNNLKEISSFNVSARYDIFKLNLYKKATPQYAAKWQKIGQEFYQRVSSLLP